MLYNILTHIHTITYRKSCGLLAFEAHLNRYGTIVNTRDHVISAVQPYTRFKGKPLQRQNKKYGSCCFPRPRSYEHADI